MEKLPFKEVLKLKEQYDYLEAGKSVRVNHDSLDCTGDSNSMKIERTEDGNLSIYCFRCGRSGFYNAGFIKTGKALGEANAVCTDSVDGECKTLNVPRGEGEVSRWPKEARAWIRRSGVTQEEVTKYGIVYSDELNRAVIPWLDSNGKPAHYQTRRIDDDDGSPKYLSYWRDRIPVTMGISMTGKDMVLVEDSLSAIRIARQHPVTALLGVYLWPQHIDTFVKMGYNNFMVWLDDDNPKVKIAQLKLKLTLNKIGKCLIYHGKGVDPKELSDEEIADVLMRWKTGMLS